MRVRRPLALAVTGLVLWTPAPVAAVAPVVVPVPVPVVAPVDAAPAPAVCSGVPGCHVVAHADVDGDGSRDTVAIARRGADGAERGSVLVRVETAPGRVVSARRPTRFWHGGLWQGAAWLDGHRGKELVVGSTMGAHAEFFTALTWRRGRLVTLDAPGRGRHWGVDSAAMVVLGWQRRAGEPGVVRKREAERRPDGSVHGTVRTYRWNGSGWTRIQVVTFARLSARRAGAWAGWHVRGLDRW